MSVRGWPLATLIFGLATLAILVAFSMLPDVKAAYPAGDFAPQLSAFQRATSMGELNALFGDPADAAKLQAMSAGNTLDLYGFIPVYTIFLLAAAVMLAGGVRKRIGWLAIGAAFVGAVADVMETWTQLQMTNDWSLAEDLLPYVAPSCWAKYFALGTHALGCSLICFLGEKKRWFLGTLGLTPFAGVFADWAGLVHVPTLMSMVFGVFWIALMVVAAIRTLPAKGGSA